MTVAPKPTEAQRKAAKEWIVKWQASLRAPQAEEENDNYGSYEDQVNDYWKSQSGC